MKLLTKFLVCLACAVLIVSAKDAEKKESKQLVEDSGTARFLASLYFPIFPQFYDLDYGSVLEFFAQPDTIGYFVIRDITAYFGVMAFWIIAHTMIWDGEATGKEDLPLPFQILALGFSGTGPSTTASPAKIDQGLNALSNEASEYEKLYFGENEATEKLSISSIYDISINGLYNFLTNPKTAAGNLYLALGFGFFGMIVWLLPTFFWTGRLLPENDTLNPNDRDDKKGTEIEDRIGGIIHNLENDQTIVKTYNRVWSPQSIARVAIINAVGLTGKILFWTFIAKLPKDWPTINLTPENGFGLLGRSFSSVYQRSLSEARKPLTWKYTIETTLDSFLEQLQTNIEMVQEGFL